MERPIPRVVIRCQICLLAGTKLNCVDNDSSSDMFYLDAFIREDATLIEVEANNNTPGIHFEF